MKGRSGRLGEATGKRNSTGCGTTEGGDNVFVVSVLIVEDRPWPRSRAFATLGAVGGKTLRPFELPTLL